MNEEKNIGVIGLGNPLNGDDGIGIVLIQKLEERGKSPHISIFDAGTGGMKVLHFLKDLDKVIIIDAVDLDKEPGDFVFFNPEEVKSLKEPSGTHDSNLFEVLELSKDLGEIPDEIIIMGIQPKCTEIGEDLSDEVENNLENMLDSLEEMISELK
ncbi:MAG: hydrogenase maturation protease [Candidatus Saliniplasma sp.]